MLVLYGVFANWVSGGSWRSPDGTDRFRSQLQYEIDDEAANGEPPAFSGHVGDFELKTHQIGSPVSVMTYTAGDELVTVTVNINECAHAASGFFEEEEEDDEAPVRCSPVSPRPRADQPTRTLRVHPMSALCCALHLCGNGHNNVFCRAFTCRVAPPHNRPRRRRSSPHWPGRCE